MQIIQKIIESSRKDFYQVNNLTDDMTEVEVKLEVLNSELDLPEGFDSMPLYFNRKLVSFIVF